MIKKHFKYLLIILIYISIISCQKIDPQDQLNDNREINKISHSEISDVMSKIGNSLGLDNVNRSTAAKLNTEFGTLEIDQIIEMVDSLDNRIYTFSILDEDDDPHTFSNLIIKKSATGTIEEPYINEYKIARGSLDTFIQGGMSLSNFTGVRRKTSINEYSQGVKSQAFIDDYKSNISSNCPNVTYYNSGTTIGSGPSDGFNNYNTGNDSSYPSYEGHPTTTPPMAPTCHDIVIATISWEDCYTYGGCEEYSYDVVVTICDTPPSHTEANTQTNCFTGDQEEFGVIVSDEEFRKYLLARDISENPFKLLDVNCDQLPNWQALTQHTPPQSVIDKVQTLDTQNPILFDEDWDIQYIQDASGPVVNLDYFPVKITRMPNNPSSSQPYTPSEFLNHVRKNMNDFFQGNRNSFEAYSSSENNIWNTSNPLGAIMRFNINVSLFGIVPGSQDGSVITSAYESNKWIFTTIKSQNDFKHPVSGNREFGIITNDDGTFTLYTRGVDRVASRIDNFLGNLPGNQNAFEGADELWSKFQDNIESFVNNPQNGGEASKQQPTISRPDWKKVKDVLEGKRPISDLGC